MKFAYIVLAIVVIGGIAVLLTNQPAAAPASTETNAVESDTMPVAEANAVEEMAVADTTVMEDEMVDESTETMETPAAVTPPAPAAQPESHTFTVTGTNFAFDVTEMRVKEGDTVTVNFEAAEGFHDWVIDAFDAATDQVRPGTPTSVTFVADAAGTYEYYCSVGSHRAQGMVGTLIVE